MANEYYSTDGALASVADAIRVKGGTTAALVFPSGFITAIQNLKYNPGAASHPIFSYTGTYQKVFNTDGSWELRLLTSGTLKFSSLSTPVDLFLVGGGGAGGYSSYENDGTYHGGGGGGGGRVTSVKGTQLALNTSYAVEIGAGGINTNGGQTKAFNLSVLGGNAADQYHGGNGGSGGGTGGYSHTSNGGAGGVDGSDGEKISGGTNAGNGSGLTTRAFGDSNGIFYAGGGGGGAGINSSGTAGSPGMGGAGGGGSGGSGVSGSRNGFAGTANTGGGGGGAFAYSSALGAFSGGDGGSGIVIIRNMR